MGLKENFDKYSKEYDQKILKYVPYYNQMIESLIISIPFEPNDNINVLELGCGTGTITKLFKEKFIRSKITCLDFSDKMLRIAKEKLKIFSDIKFIIQDLNNINFIEKYDVTISSLTLHHLETDNDKIIFFKKIYDNLNNNGVFYNADVILGSNDYLQNKYLEKKIEFMKKSLSDDEIYNNWLPRYKIEDKPSKLIYQLKWLEEIGFKEVDVVWKYYNYAVYGGYKK